MVEDDLCRNVVNHRTSRIKRMFKWAVSEELLPGNVFHALQAVSGLRYGRTEARETEPIKPVPDEHVEALLPFLTPTVAAMVQLQRLTGMRPGEVVRMRPCDIDRTGELWIYEPAEHKTRWRGHHKLVPLGPKAQKVIEPFLTRPDDAYLFSPVDAEAWRREHRPVHVKEQRKTPVYPCELRRLEREKQARRRRKRKRPLRERYDPGSYGRAIVYSLKKAKKAGVEIAHWHPNQLRHSRGTEVRREHGIEAAQVLLGHARADVTQVYAERNFQLACEIAKATG
jgi:integrase